MTSRNAANQSRAALWDGTGLVDLGTLPGGTNRSAAGSTTQGQIVGTSFVDATRLHGFLIDDGVMYDLNDLLPPDSVEVDERQCDRRLWAHPRPRARMGS